MIVFTCFSLYSTPNVAICSENALRKSSSVCGIRPRGVTPFYEGPRCQAPALDYFDLYLAIFILTCRDCLRRSCSRFVHGRRPSLNRSRWAKGEQLRPYGDQGGAVDTRSSIMHVFWVGRLSEAGRSKCLPPPSIRVGYQGTDHLMLYTRQAREVNRTQKSTPSVATVPIDLTREVVGRFYQPLNSLLMFERSPI